MGLGYQRFCLREERVFGNDSRDSVWLYDGRTTRASACTLPLLQSLQNNAAKEYRKKAGLRFRGAADIRQYRQRCFCLASLLMTSTSACFFDKSCDFP